VVRGLDGGEDGFERSKLCVPTTAVCASTAVCTSTAVCASTKGGAVCAALDKGVVVPAGVVPAGVKAGCLEPATEASVLGPFAFLALLRVVRGLAKDGVRDDSVLLSLGVMCQHEKKSFSRRYRCQKKKWKPAP
jgi:hypothetical protein